MTTSLESLVTTVDSALGDTRLTTDRARAEAMRPAMEALLADPDGVPAWAEQPHEGGAVGNLLHADPAGRFHVLAVVFPEGTSSGVHLHGCWGVIGYLRGGDEETRYVERDGEPVEDSRYVWHQGDVTYLLPEEGEGWHRVRNPGPGDGVSVHVLCRTPAEHPHLFWDRDARHAVDFPFVEVAPDRWVARLVG
ncbi:MAG TPA: cysteine dioxygenase family protein [Acidimicrobiales bacterium]|nr:cysteine dioxygenase family protein [Acidimicrobiales bacterium]